MILFVIGLLVFFVFGFFFISKGKDCLTNINYPNVLENSKLVNCGYLLTDDNETVSMYAGKVNKLYIKNGKIFLELDFGSHKEDIVLGNFEENNSIQIVKMNNPIHSEGKLKENREIISLDERGFLELNGYVGKYVLFSISLQRPEQTVGFGYRCNDYEKTIKNYFINGENFFDFWKMNLKKILGCYLSGSNLYVF